MKRGFAPLSDNVAVDDGFDASEFARLLSRGVGHGRASASSRVAERHSSHAAAATNAMMEFARAASDPEKHDIIGAYLTLCPGAPHLFAALWLGAVRPAATSAALDCLLAIVEYARARGSRGSSLPESPISLAKSVAKDIVKGRTAAVSEALSRNGSEAASKIANKTLRLLTMVAESHPLLAKETIHRLDFSSRNLAPSLCNRASHITRASFCSLVVALLTSGDHDVVFDLATRSRQALLSCLKAFTSEPSPSNYLGGGEAADVSSKVILADEAALHNLLLAMRERILRCPNRSLARSAFEHPMLEYICHVAAYYPSSKSVQQEAEKLFADAISLYNVITPVSVAKVLSGLPITESKECLSFTLRSIWLCPRASRFIIENGIFLQSQPRLSSSWLACAAVLAKCVRCLEIPSSAFCRAKFFESCWSNECALVRHMGIMIATAFCDVVLRNVNTVDDPRIFLPPIQSMHALLRKHQIKDRSIYPLLARYRFLFDREYTESKTDILRLATEAACFKNVVDLRPVTLACLRCSRSSTLSTLFRLRLVSRLFTSMKNEGSVALLQKIFEATGLFPPGTAHEIEIWLTVVKGVKQEESLRKFERLVCEAWEKPYALFDEIQSQESDLNISTVSCSLVSAAAVRRLQKLHQIDNVNADENVDFAKLLAFGLYSVQMTCASNAISSELSRILKPFEAWLRGHDYDELGSTFFMNKIWHISSARELQFIDETTKSLLCDFVEHFSCRPGMDGPVARYLLPALLDVKSQSTPNSQVDNYLAAALMAYSLRVSCIDRFALDRLLLAADFDNNSPFSVSAVPLNGTLHHAHRRSFVLAASLSYCPITDPVQSLLTKFLCTALTHLLKNETRDSQSWRELFQVARFLKRNSLLTLGTTGIQNFVQALASVRIANRQAEHLELISCILQNENETVRMVGRASLGLAIARGSLRLDFRLFSRGSVQNLCVLLRSIPSFQDRLHNFISSADSASETLSGDTIFILLPAIAIAVDNILDDENKMRDVSSKVLPPLLTSRTDRACVGRLDRQSIDCIYRELRGLFEKLFRYLPNAEDYLGQYFSRYILHTTDDFSEVNDMEMILCRSLLCATSNAVVIPCQILLDLLLKYAKLMASCSYEAAWTLNDLLQLIKRRRILTQATVSVVESVEAAVSLILKQAAERAREDVCMLHVVASALEQDLILNRAATKAISILTNADYIIVIKKHCLDDSCFASALGRVAELAVIQLNRSNLSRSTAESLVEFEALFSALDFCRGTLVFSDTTIFSAMRAMARKLSKDNCRNIYSLPERRDGPFHVRASDVIQTLEPNRLAETADVIVSGTTHGTNGYDGFFLVDLLRRAAIDASRNPNVALLDLGYVARSGLLGVAMAGLTVAEVTFRTCAYAALAAFMEAVGPISGVPSDAAAALYIDRRQLSFLLHRLCSSIRKPLERLSSLPLTYYRTISLVILQPTHACYREVTKSLLRTPIFDVHDAEELTYLLRDPNKSNRRLALDILRRGLCTAEDHYIARRRRIYDTLFAMERDHADDVLDVFLAIAHRGPCQITADLIRSHGILSWLISSGLFAQSNKRLLLLATLVRTLPHGVLSVRYASSFIEILEDIARHPKVDTSELSRTALAITRLAPMANKRFELDDRYQDDIIFSVFGKKQKAVSVSLIQRVLCACCEASNGEFPSSHSEQLAAQAFIAENVIRDKSCHTDELRYGLACLLQEVSRVTIWSIVASIAVLGSDQWNIELSRLAEELPGAVQGSQFRHVDTVVNNAQADPMRCISDSTRKCISELLLK